MNKRATQRLVGVTVIILAVILAIVLGSGNRNASYYVSVKKVTSNGSQYVGKRVKVGGMVVAGSWNKKSNPMEFSIREEKDTSGSGPTLKVVYNGAVPSTFGDGVVAIVTGELGKDGTVNANEMITKCPSKYESATGALTVADLLGKGSVMVGKTTKITGGVKAGTLVAPGSGPRFTLQSGKDTGKTLGIVFEGALPSGLKDGSIVVVTGSLEKDGNFVATNVAMEKSQK